ncbi:tRNA uridine(34) 5-carboxymethylaminomethyl modification radical SAM/GNAT enzyme Elp3 [Candidatus Dojkabacteria bacterium]|nr:tRNA uridine(34) 5-carboxymethylaminomethyl modification radical SAM/GNAT enzyme Elp3 [Candidatus Dojkabacteria bacterium]
MLDFSREKTPAKSLPVKTNPESGIYQNNPTLPIGNVCKVTKTDIPSNKLKSRQTRIYWYNQHMAYRTFDPTKYERELLGIFQEVLQAKKLNQSRLRKILHKYPRDGNKIFSKDQLVQGFQYLKSNKKNFAQKELPEYLKKRPVRTISGVTTVTVLTKPFPCPGRCIFCPNDITMPKSYIASEPGAQRAIANRFDPFKQVYNRLKALHQIGHPTEKIELLVLGGTWSYYPESYQIWFIKRCFEGLNAFDPLDLKEFPRQEIEFSPNNFNNKIRKQTGKKTYNELINTKEYKDNFAKEFETSLQKSTWEELFKEHKINETAHARNVGLVLETRPDTIDTKEVLKLRRFGATKIQIGVQTLDPIVNKANKRFETIEQIRNAFSLLRQAGFKIHAHMMPNLYKSTPLKDLKTYKDLFNQLDFKPDELKIYPTSIIPHTELARLQEQGKYEPYSPQTLSNLLADMIETTPRYCRLSRIVRDIPSGEIVTGNKITNLRQLIEARLETELRKNENIRAREIKNIKFDKEQAIFKSTNYKTNTSIEYFLEYVSKDDKLLGFLRLSLPNSKTNPITNELNNSAIIREVHIYGPAQNIRGSKSKKIIPTKSKAQHIGFGTKLLQKAISISKEMGFDYLSVISAIGTREYYRKRGFRDGRLYQKTKTHLSS